MVKIIRLVFNSTLAFFSGLVVFYVFFYFVRFWISIQGKAAAEKLRESKFYLILKLVPSILIAIYVLFIGVLIYYTLKGKREKEPGRVL